uniref:hypothetical protein n=1 Tax=Salmonella enterica TaxID=28901 RepID=UPI00398C253F
SALATVGLTAGVRCGQVAYAVVREKMQGKHTIWGSLGCTARDSAVTRFGPRYDWADARMEQY